ncbi:MAG: DUF916 domain-containing protein [Pseudomonadales bacterium]|nr:DUF916 domain-containing protein [Pseudomonadales bacterium]
MLTKLIQRANPLALMAVLGAGFLIVIATQVHAIAMLDGTEPAPIETDGEVNIVPATLTLDDVEILSTEMPVEEVVPSTPNNANRVISLTAVPPRVGDDFSLVLQPGQTTQVALEVRNPSDEAITIQSFARDFIIGDDGETPLPVENVDISNRWSLASWLTITPNAAVIEPRQSVSIVVTISVPEDAMAGGRYAMVLHRPALSESGGATTGSQVSAQVGSLFYVIVEGDITEDAFITDFEFTRFSETGPVDFSFNFQNESSTHIRPEITITIKNIFGQVREEIVLEQRNIFPGTGRSYEGVWENRWGFGPYRAEITASYGRQTVRTATATTTFWIVPFRIIAIVIIVIVMIVAIMQGTKRKYKKMYENEEVKVRKLDEKLRKSREANRQANLTNNENNENSDIARNEFAEEDEINRE